MILDILAIFIFLIGFLFILLCTISWIVDAIKCTNK